MASRIPLNCGAADLFSHTLSILDGLVSFDTTSHKSNLKLIGYVQELLAGNGIDSHLHWNDARSKANLVATARAGDDGQRGIIWSGHTDIVPVDGQFWTSDPFTMRVTGDRVIGRGTADMKGFIACCLSVLSVVDQAALATPITLVLTYEEEVGCVGAHRLVQDLRTWPDRCVGCIVGEPTEMKVVVGHKGKQNYRIQFTGEPRHAALAPETANPIMAAAELAVFTQSLNQRFQSAGPRDRRFVIDHSWINIGRIVGGIKSNIVPDSCLVELEIRAVPAQSCYDIASELNRYVNDELLPELRTRLASAAASMEQLSDTPGFAMDQDHAFVRLVRSAIGQPGSPEYVSFGTEAGLFWGHAGIPTVVCGPGSIDQAHAPNESIPLEQLRICLSHIQSLLLAQ